MKQKNFVETRNLSVGYSDRALIRDISLGFQKGEIVTLIGPNGAGKSTILKTLTRHLEAVGGSVVIDGQDLRRIPYGQLATRVAVVLTQRLQTDWMTCWDVVASGRYPYTGRMGLLSREDRRKVEESMARVRILELAERDFQAISDGQRQRVLLARAICQEPEIIVLDEPTSFLDIRHKLELLGILRSMAKERGITVILSLHEIDLAEKVSDRLVCVKGERIFAFGTVEEIFRQEVIGALYDLEPERFNIRFGSVELPRPEGAPRVFVIAGAGTGIPVFRGLQRQGIPFATGVLHEHDADYQVAAALASQIIAERAFFPIAADTYERARERMRACERVIYTDFPIGPDNALQEELVRQARACGLPLELW